MLSAAPRCLFVAAFPRGAAARRGHGAWEARASAAPVRPGPHRSARFSWSATRRSPARKRRRRRGKPSSLNDAFPLAAEVAECRARVAWVRPSKGRVEEPNAVRRSEQALRCVLSPSENAGRDGRDSEQPRHLGASRHRRIRRFDRCRGPTLGVPSTAKGHARGRRPRVVQISGGRGKRRAARPASRQERQAEARCSQDERRTHRIPHARRL